ncbi:lipoprotein LpqH [Brachybacterium sp. AOP42-B2-9]|uniref:lipoprotein LpqH n=1 Tax=Brachybacterium sp. AOP42-B2-9 TaxID=3457672 RepID=UPI004033B2A6
MSVLERSSARCAVGVLAALALAGCGDVGGASDAGREPSGGRWEATLGGEPVELEFGMVDCESIDGSMHLRIGDISTQNPSRSTGISAVITDPDHNPQVASARFSLPDGRTLLYSPATTGGVGVPSTEVVVDGDTYDIEGAGTLTGTSNDQATTRFTLTVSCG